MLSEKLMECLVCPVCRAAPLGLSIEEKDGDSIVKGTIACPDCKRWYHVRGDIPVMMPPDLGSNLAASNQRWESWGAAMHRFLRWREAAWADAEQSAKRRESAREMHERFIGFCDLPDGPIDVLDIGCGSGHVADLLSEDACYLGLDPLPGGRGPGGDLPPEMPRPQRQVSFVQGVGELMPIADDSFDAILMMGTFDHARSPEEMLAEASRVVRPGGAVHVLLGLGHADDAGGLGGIVRSIVRSLTAQQAPSARDTHLHTFSSADEVTALLAERFDVADTMEYQGRIFVRANASADRE